MELEIGDASISYETMGQGLPVVMLHGFTLDRHVLKGCMEPMFENRAGWERFYLDLPGMGSSVQGSRTTDADDMLDLLLAFLDAAVPEGPFVVVGQSYGGYLAPALAMARKERLAGIMLLCPVVDPARSGRDLPQRTVLQQDVALIASLDPLDRRDFLSMSIIRDSRTWTRFRQDILPGLRSGDPQFLRAFQHIGYSLSRRSVPPTEEFEVPALVLTGKQDSWVGYKDAERKMDNYHAGTYAALDRAGHLLQVEQEDIFRAMVSEWMDRVERSLVQGTRM